jgi:hypothetical protein
MGTDDGIGIQPPAPAAVELLGAVAVRDGAAGDVELHVDGPRIHILDGGIGYLDGHFQLLRLGGVKFVMNVRCCVACRYSLSASSGLPFSTM